MKKAQRMAFLVLAALAFLWSIGSQSVPAVASAEISGAEIKYVALTFDDGPRANTTGRLLDGLLKRNAKATFFLIGRQIETNRDLVLRMKAEGHQVGNHTYDHLELEAINPTVVAQQIGKTDAILQNLLGEGTYWVRPPFGCVSATEKKLISQPMKLSFFGADQFVTGSCHCLEVNGKTILIDCGLQQGRDEISNAEFPFAANAIDYVLVTHAHIDHSGRIPMLITYGFSGEILTTRVTAALMEIMLADSAHIQESDAEWKNRKGKRAGSGSVEPLYTIEDAQRVSEFVKTCEYNQVVDLCEGVKVRFVDAGHLLGSACIELTLTEDSITKKIVFSGDLGNVNQPIISDPTHLHAADYVVMESTYGDRNHEGVWSYTDDLAKIIDQTMHKVEKPQYSVPSQPSQHHSSLPGSLRVGYHNHIGQFRIHRYSRCRVSLD